MKFIVSTLLFASIVVTFNSCKKNAEPNSPTKGQWEWILSRGGFSGNQVVKPLANSIVALTLDSSLVYTVYLDNQVNAQGIYQITAAPGNEPIIFFDTTIVTDNLVLHNEQIVLNRNDSLILYDYNISEGSEHYFTKIK